MPNSVEMQKVLLFYTFSHFRTEKTASGPETKCRGLMSLIRRHLAQKAGRSSRRDRRFERIAALPEELKPRLGHISLSNTYARTVKNF